MARDNNVVPKELHALLNNAINVAVRKQYGPPGEAPGNITAAIAVATMQISLHYFSATGAPKEVVEKFFRDLMHGEETPKGPVKIEQDGNRLNLVGPDGRPILRRPRRG